MFYYDNGFNPRPPCGERRGRACRRICRCWFQSTPPVWGATIRDLVIKLISVVSIHAPRVGSDEHLEYRDTGIDVSIHAPRVGSDSFNHSFILLMDEFQSTPPVWGATGLSLGYPLYREFQSTPPVWGATEISILEIRQFKFQSTPPVWGATWFLSPELQGAIVSIHAPRVGSDKI